LCGVRSKSRTERVVDLHEAATLEAVSAYVMHERPHDTMSPILFLVGGNGPRRPSATGDRQRLHRLQEPDAAGGHGRPAGPLDPAFRRDRCRPPPASALDSRFRP
jgi:hypothetical protein